ncbi:MAG: 8-amino-7-oxononanoate synthase [Pseudanabaenaceae cyanobacterium]
MTHNSAYSWLDASLETIHKAGWYRQPQVITAVAGMTVGIDDRSYINFASNNYLGLAGDQRLKLSAISAIEKYGTGATSARLVVGNYTLHQTLEQKIAQWKQTESALVFSSGYATNMGLIPALVGSRDIIFADAYNHSCLKNGAKLSQAKVIEYKHSNYQELAQLLAEYRHLHRRALIITDSVFSMDGDIAPLTEIAELSDRFSAMLLVDEAHGVGVFGKTGAGVIEALGITTPLIQMGTLSKALGSLGGYVAGSHQLITYLQNRCASWIYTTGLSPADTAAACTAIEIVQTEPELRQKLWANCQLLAQRLGISVTSPIVPLFVGDIPKTLAIAQKLQSAGLLVPAIRPPTVPTPRLRISLSALHTPDQIIYLAEIIKQSVQSTS